MSAHLLCLTAGGGIPLFCKTKGELKQLPFAVTGSLNGVHMFAGTQGVKLLTTHTSDSKILWKTYRDSVTLILVTQDDGVSDLHLERLVDYIFQAMVLLYGLDNISHIKNVERFKREIKICNQLVESILDLLDDPKFCVLTNSVEVVSGQDTAVLQSYVDTFCEAASTPYGCVMMRGQVAVATTQWWELTAVELVLLRLLVSSLSSCSSRDVPVYLPSKFPDVPHRLMTFHLVQGVEVCVLCGPSPSLDQLEREIDRFWKSSVESLKNLLRNSERVIPEHVTVDLNISGLLLVNTETHRCLCSMQPHSVGHNRTTGTNQMETVRRKRVLQSFYKYVLGHHWAPSSSSFTEGSDQQQTSDLHQNMVHKVTDVYMAMDTHKCYALQQGTRLMFVLYNSSVPTYAMRSITQKTLATMVKEKCIQV